jgi:hypothetical protein
MKLMTSTPPKDDQEHQYLDIQASELDSWQGEVKMVEPVALGWTSRKDRLL